MTFPFTGFVYLLVAFGLGFFAYRLFQHWRLEKESQVAQLFFYIIAIFTLVCFIAGVGGILFTLNQNQIIAKIITFGTLVFVILGCSVMGFLIFLIKFPKMNPWFGFILIFLLGIATFILTTFTPFQFTLKAMGGIDWGFHPLVYLFRFSLYLFTAFPLSIIFLQKFKTSKDPYIRSKALGLSLIFLVISIVVFIDFILEPTFKMEAVLSEITLAILSIFLFGFLFATRQLHPPLYRKRV